jgi:hypothetical protein
MLTTPAGWLLPLAVLAPFVGLLAGLSAQAGGKFLQTILVCLAGGLLALGLRGRPMPVRAGAALPLHRATAAAGALIEWADGFLRRWPTAALALLMLVAVFFGSMLRQSSAQLTWEQPCSSVHRSYPKGEFRERRSASSISQAGLGSLRGSIGVFAGRQGR